MSKSGATAIGFFAIAMWATLAALSSLAVVVPPLELTAITFFIGSLVGIASWVKRPAAAKAVAQNWKVWALGVGGLFSYHALYFAAVQHAPAIDVSLIAYLWPTLIVVLSGLLPGEKIRLHHIIGTALGLLGAALVISRGNTQVFAGGIQLGHLLALPLPLIWAGYSLLARKTKKVPTDVIAGFCLATAVLSGLAHVLLEPTIWPQGAGAWAAIGALGFFPVGLAFYAWDFGLKHGDIFVLGALSYCSPLFSTLLLIATGLTTFHWSVALACVLITLGAVIAAKDTIFYKAI
ncbi:MAG: EamA family transporter [Pseudomonadota bacterium]|nr:EamA family transporter [Pseudomonadota bacterium]